MSKEWSALGPLTLMNLNLMRYDQRLVSHEESILLDFLSQTFLFFLSLTFSDSKTKLPITVCIHIYEQMENCNRQGEKMSLINELAQGREIARQLHIDLNVPSSSHGTRELLVHKIIVSYEKALSMLSSSSSATGGEQQLPTGHAAIRMVESPQPSLNGSPRSEDSDREFKDQDNKDSSRKRKTMPRWTQQIRVTSDMGLERPLDDCFSWRKYGRKDILGAKYPRSYYRCTHRKAQACLAMKQVQRSNEDPTLFKITYRGRHTCTQASTTSTTSAPPPPQNGMDIVDPQVEQNQQQPQDMLLTIPQGLTVVTEGLDAGDQELFPYHPSSALNHKYANVGHFSPPFMGPATSGIHYFSVSEQGFGEGSHSFQGAKSQIAEILSSATSATNSPSAAALGFPFGQADQNLYPNFSFDGPGFFSS